MKKKAVLSAVLVVVLCFSMLTGCLFSSDETTAAPTDAPTTAAPAEEVTTPAATQAPATTAAVTTTEVATTTEEETTTEAHIVTVKELFETSQAISEAAENQSMAIGMDVEYSIEMIGQKMDMTMNVVMNVDVQGEDLHMKGT